MELRSRLHTNDNDIRLFGKGVFGASVEKEQHGQLEVVSYMRKERYQRKRLQSYRLLALFLYVLKDDIIIILLTQQVFRG